MKRLWSHGAALAAPVLLVVLVLFGAPARADELADLMKGAMAAKAAGEKCVAESRKAGANQVLENQKAAAHFEQAVRLLEKYMEARPDDDKAAELMSDVTSFLFWCHKMSPVDTAEEIAARPVTEAPPPTESKPAEPDPAALAAAAEAEARRLLDEAHEHLTANPADEMGTMIKLEYVAERFAESESGKVARKEADDLQAKLFAQKPVAPEKVKLAPLTNRDTAAIERLLKDWLETRRRIRCTSCKGEGSSPCKTCDGSGEVRGMAGRRATCTRCRRGKVACERKACIEGVDATVLERAVIDSRAPYYQETIRALLGGKKDSVKKFCEALAAVLIDSPRAPAEISRCATELGIAPVQLRDVIDTHGPPKSLVAPFTTYSLKTVDRTTTYTLRGDGSSSTDENVSLEQEQGKWYLRRLGAQ